MENQKIRSTIVFRIFCQSSPRSAVPSFSVFSSMRYGFDRRGGFRKISIDFTRTILYNNIKEVILMYEYIQKPKSSETAHNAKQTNTQSLTRPSADQNGGEDKLLLDDQIHEKVFGKTEKPAQMRKSAYTQDTEKRLEQGQPARGFVVQRMFSPQKRKKERFDPWSAWKTFCAQLSQILPDSLQGQFQQLIDLQNSNMTMPGPGDFVLIANQFATLITQYLNTPHEVGDLATEAIRAGGGVVEQDDTGGHTNHVVNVFVPLVEGGVAYFKTGTSRAHGKKQRQSQKVFEVSKLRDADKDAQIIEQNGIAFKIFQLIRTLPPEIASSVMDILMAIVDRYKYVNPH